ncbi:terminase gpP N-terminus-related DNA-binding protein [Nodularia spumigena]|jgi:DNA-binding XRE family transcriptional regulator|uniref:terminase gpP N-terminus-related DNA-binding protein n=1 Tax=Nodularia spumigena TaxID=70799 RepID=UPI00233129EC|nr:phage terminase small subunit-related protein [Nodularia spumigena]MDB9498579.1 phage terminase small subunit-related protein [Nodularia spumigena CS-336/02]
MAKANERKLAESLYIDGNLTQKEIAEQLGVTEKTLIQWKDKYNWEKLRIAKRTTKSEIINGLYMSISRIMKNAQEDKNRALSSSETDQIVKLTRSIEVMEGSESLANYVQAMTAFIKYVQSIDIDAAKSIMPWTKEFLTQKAGS